MSFAIKNSNMMCLCPYCKGAEFYIFKYPYYTDTRSWNQVEQIVCTKCRWFKKDVDLSTPWGPYHPDVQICEGVDVFKNTNQDMTVIPTPPEETVPVSSLPEIASTVLVPLDATRMPHQLAAEANLADPPGPELKPEPYLIDDEEATMDDYEGVDEPVTPKPSGDDYKWGKDDYEGTVPPEPKKTKKPKKSKKPSVNFPGDGSKWEEI